MKKLLIFLFLFLLSGCITLDTSKIQQSENIDYQKLKDSKVYQLDLNALEEVEQDPPNFIFLIKDSKTGLLREAEDNEESDFAVLNLVELKKIEKMLIVKNAYKDIVHNQLELINLEKEKVSILVDMLEVSQKNYNILLDRIKEERKQFFRDKLIDKATLIFVVIGGIAVAAL